MRFQIYHPNPSTSVMNNYIMFNKSQWSFIDSTQLKPFLIYMSPLKSLFNSKKTVFFTSFLDYSFLLKNLGQVYYFGILTPGFLSNHKVTCFNKTSLLNPEQVFKYYPFENSKVKPAVTSILYDMNDKVELSMASDLLSQDRLLFSSSNISNIADFPIPQVFTPYFIKLFDMKHFRTSEVWPNAKQTFESRVLLKSFFNKQFRVNSLTLLRMKKRKKYLISLHRSFFRRYHDNINFLLLRRSSLKLIYTIFFFRRKFLKKKKYFKDSYFKVLKNTLKILSKFALFSHFFTNGSYYPTSIFKKKKVKIHESIRPEIFFFNKNMIKPAWGQKKSRCFSS